MKAREQGSSAPAAGPLMGVIPHGIYMCATGDNSQQGMRRTSAEEFIPLELSCLVAKSIL